MANQPDDHESTGRTGCHLPAISIYLLDHLLEGCQVLDQEGRCVYVNDAAARKARRSKEELLGRKMDGLYPGIETAEMFRMLDGCTKERTHQRMENEFTFPDGSKGWIDLRFAPVPGGVLVFSQDITERKRHEDEVLRLNAVLRGVRGVNQVITRERDPDRLIRQACNVLVESRGVETCLVVLTSGSRVKSWAAAGTTEAFARLVEPLERGEMPHCIGTALADPLVPLRRLDTDVCRDAPDDGPAARGFAVIGLPLCCDGRTFGVMVASIPAAAAGDPEAEGLLIEAAGDIGFAMRGFELVAQATAAAKFLQVGMNRLETIIRSSPAAIYSFDSEGRVLSWNPAAERIFGWPTNEVVGCKIPIVPSDRWAEHLSRTERVFSGEEVPSIVTECVRRDGSRVPVGVSAAPLREVDGTVVGILGMGWDLSDLRMAELDLRRSEERYRDLVENLEDIVYAIDTEGRFRFIGSAVTRYGYSMEDLAGRPFSEFLHPDDLPAIGEAFARALAGETAPVECRALDKAGGVRNFRISARPTVEDGRPVGFSGVIVDVTDQKQMEARLAGQTQEILESQVVTIQALARLAESRDDDTGHHIERVRTFARVLAETMRESRGGDDELSDAFVQNLFHGAPLHDVGKVGIPDAVLLKPGKLTPDEFGLIKTHTTLGADTLAAVHQRYPKNEFLRMGMDIARSHHEKWDGSGYPDGLRGADIPLAARIVAVADVYDALRARRPYKEPFPHEKACAIIIEGGGKHFDPEVIVAFRTVEARFAEIRAKLED